MIKNSMQTTYTGAPPPDGDAQRQANQEGNSPVTREPPDTATTREQRRGRERGAAVYQENQLSLRYSRSSRSVV